MTWFPRDPGELTLEWLRGVLQGQGRGRADPTSFTCHQIGTGLGLAGQIARVALDGSSQGAPGPASLVAKFPPADSATRAIGNALRLYERERLFYELLAEETPVATPQCFFNGYDHDADAYLLLLEDLGQQTVGDQLQGWTPEQGRDAVDTMAALHARWWDAVDTDVFSWMPVWNDAALVATVQHAYRQAWPAYDTRFGSDLSTEIREIAGALADALPSLMNDIAAPPQTLVHGDFRMDNLFFGGADRVTVIDWQIVCRGRGAFDLAYFLVQSGTVELRRAHEEELIRRYAAALSAAGVRGYDESDCRADYRRCVLYSLVYPVISGGGMDLGNARGVELIRTVSARVASALTDHDCTALLRAG